MVLHKLDSTLEWLFERSHFMLFFILVVFLPSLVVAIPLGIVWSVWYALALFVGYVAVCFWDIYLRNGDYTLDFKGFYNNIQADIEAKAAYLKEKANERTR